MFATDVLASPFTLSFNPFISFFAFHRAPGDNFEKHKQSSIWSDANVRNHSKGSFQRHSVMVGRSLRDLKGGCRKALAHHSHSAVCSFGFQLLESASLCVILHWGVVGLCLPSSLHKSF